MAGSHRKRAKNGRFKKRSKFRVPISLNWFVFGLGCCIGPYLAWWVRWNVS